MMTQTFGSPFTRQMKSESNWRSTLALGLGWLAYAIFYATVVAVLIGVPVGLAFFLVRIVTE